MKKLLFITILLLTAGAYAAVPVAVMPFDGDDSNVLSVQARVKELLVKTDGLSVVADNLMPDLIKIHEKAQALGSEYHDISKLKIAEYMVFGTVSGGKLNLRAVDVNQGLEIYSTTIDVTGDSGRIMKKTVREMADKILFRVSSRGEEVPSEAAQYMEVINGFTASLSKGDEASFRYMAVYSKTGYVHPASDNPKAVENAKRFLKVVRQDLNRAKITFISLKGEKDWIYVDVVVEKGGKQTKFRFSLLELDDGTLGITACDEVR